MKRITVEDKIECLTVAAGKARELERALGNIALALADDDDIDAVPLHQLWRVAQGLARRVEALDRPPCGALAVMDKRN